MPYRNISVFFRGFRGNNIRLYQLNQLWFPGPGLKYVPFAPDVYCMKQAILVMTLLMVSACSDLSDTDTELFDPGMAAQAWNTADKAWNIDELEILENGKSLYRSRCSGCHQQAGTGSTTIGAPALKGSAVARGSVDILIRTVLFGRGSMPPFRSSLDDVGLAKILSYVRNAWGNDMQDLVQVSRVAEIRATGGN